MLALSIGYLLGGRWSLHDPSLRRLAWLLMLGASSTIPVILFGNVVLDWVFDQVRDPRYGSLLAATVFFFIPTAIAGMVSPYAVRLLVRNPHSSGHFAGLLYFSQPSAVRLGLSSPRFIWFCILKSTRF